MYWYKVKTMLILLFFFINIFLVGTIFYGNYQDARSLREMARATENVLKKNGITLQTDIPDESGNVEAVSLSATFGDDLDHAKRLLGGTPTTTTYLNNGTLYAKGTKNLLVNGSYFEYDDTAVTPKSVITEQDADKAAALLTDLGFSLENAYPDISKDKIIYSFQVNKKPVFNTSLAVTVGNDGIKSISGYGLTVSGKNEKVKIRPAVKAVIEMLQDEALDKTRPLSITKVALGYSLFLGDDNVSFKSAEAIPTWFILLDNGQHFYYDAIKN
jgi:hypothetical protein